MKQKCCFQKSQVGLSDDWAPWRRVFCGRKCPHCRWECMTCGEAGSVGGYSYSISQHINSTTEECCAKTKVKNQYFHCFVWPASWGRERERERERRRHGEEDIEGERQDTLIWRGLVLTSLWEALFSLPWKESIWLILQAVASPCSLTSPSFGYTRIRSQKCICCFAKWKIRKSRILLTSRKVPSFLLC